MIHRGIAILGGSPNKVKQHDQPGGRNIDKQNTRNETPNKAIMTRAFITRKKAG
jgi:hypothetical protein